MLGLGTSVNRGGFVSAAPAAKLLDTYSSAAAAYSLRKLSNSYSGNAVKVRRASDDTELDIGFSSGELDTSALATHCGSSDGFVVTWYDQSGNSNNATQSTAADQPKIYDATAVRHITENGKPAIDFDGGQDSLDTGQSIRAATTFTVSKSTASGRSTVYGSQSGGAQYLRTDGTVIDFSNSQGLELSGQTSGSYNLIFVDNVSPNTSLGNNGGVVVTGSLDTSNIADFAIGQKANGNTHNGTIQEVILYGNTRFSNRTAIEADINTFYSIF